jgi:hypothetical protein
VFLQFSYSDRSIKVSPHLYDYEQKHTSQHGKSNRQNGIGKGPSNFALHVRKQEQRSHANLDSYYSAEFDIEIFADNMKGSADDSHYHKNSNTN